MGLAHSNAASARDNTVPGFTTLDAAIQAHKVVVVSKSSCPYCLKALNILRSYNLDDIVVLDAEENPKYQTRAFDLTGQRTVPNVFINGKSIGGCDATTALHKSGKLKDLLLL
jgi:glutaredoxin 3